MNAAYPIYGVMAEFDEPERFLDAVRSTRGAGYRRMDAYSPSPVEGLSDAMDLHDTRVPFAVLLGGLAGAITGFFFQYYANGIDYPINIGGRPLLSWVSFIPITFEIAVLGGSLTALIYGIMVSNGLPTPYHPVFNVPEFVRASRDRYFVCVEAADPNYDSEKTKRFLEGLNPVGVYDVPE
ncbi:MAG: DUF3341 domain-containing protein [Acidobacteriota bacterium]